MLLVVFGAGASYDSVAARRPMNDPPQTLDNDRPPLACQLFDARPGFLQDLDLFPECKSIVQELRISRTGGQFEEVLQRLQSEGDRYPTRHMQLAAVRFYLRSMLWRCEERWQSHHRGVTNYINLLDQLNMWVPKPHPIVLVTFNYDRMIEQALGQFDCSFKEISDYIRYPRFQLIKLHGSVNWGRRVTTSIPNAINRSNPSISGELIKRAPDLTFSNQYKILDHPDLVTDREGIFFPALALPVEKKVVFDCPPAHVGALTQSLKNVRRILTIGWRGSETAFLDLLRDNLPHPVPLMVIAKDGRESDDIGKHLETTGIVQDLFGYPGGFSDFVPSRDGEKFLSF